MRAIELHPEPKPLGAPLLRGADDALSALDRAVERVVPTRLNPLAHTGAIANAAFLIAAVTGVLILPWYSASVHGAHASVEAMSQLPWTAGLLRSLHRLSSDVALLFALIHGLRLFAAARLGGPRKTAWITGIALVATLWFVGWLGYWLVWDQRAQSVAVGTAKLLDGLPIFADPLSRSFLTNESVNSLLFFMVFFFHMLIPLAMGVLLWLHISHLSRSRFLPSRELASWLGLSLLVAAAIEPARSAAAADLLRPAAAFTIDSFYLLPLYLSDRLSGPALWAILFGVMAVAGSLPWWIPRGRAKVAVVDTARCNGCTLCYQDCPYDAIRMIPREDGRSWELQAEVDPDRCVGCGICAGSCDPGGIALPQLPIVDERKRIEGWIEEALGAGERPRLAFVCASSAGGSLDVDPTTGRSAQLPGYRILPVPCSGWVQRFTLERALRRGAEGVLIVGCGPTEPHFREGNEWTAQRLAGAREPGLRHEKVDAAKIHFTTLDRSQASQLRSLASNLRGGAILRHVPARWRIAGGAAALAAGGALLLALASDVPYRAPIRSNELVVSFKHPGKTSEICRPISPEERARQPPHMQRDEICERSRSAVRLRVMVDGDVILERAYEPQGLRSDGNSVAVEHLPVEAGMRRIEIAIGDGPDPATWDFIDERQLGIEANARAVILFDRLSGFNWHTGDGAS